MYKFVLAVNSAYGDEITTKVVVVYAHDEKEMEGIFGRNTIVMILEKRRIERIDIFV